MRNITRFPLLSLLAAFTLLLAAGTSAQEADSADAGSISAGDSDRFPEAYLAAQLLNHQFSHLHQQVEDPERATELQQEAQTKMQQAVTESGLSISDYQSIAQQANQDDAVRENIQNAVSAMVEAHHAQ